MPLIGNQLGSAENNSFRVLDDISNFTLTFDGSSTSVVSSANDTITLFQHPFVTGQRVTYSSGAGTQIGGLTSGSVYFIVKVDSNSFRLSTTLAGSLQNSNLVDLVSVGTGINHSFNVRFDGINTKFKATYNNGTKCQISRAAQLDIAINGVIQQPYDSNPPPNGFTIEADATIVFSTAPLTGFTFWGKALSNAIASFETSDNSIDTFTGNGSQTNFTLSKTPANSQNVLVTINGVLQYPSDNTATRSYSVNANVLVFDTAPANGSVIQVRYIGFAGATSSAVTGFYGRTGNVVLTSSDGIGVGTAKIGVGTNVGVATALLVEGNARITGILTVGTSSITFDGVRDRITVGPTFIGATGIGLGATTIAGRNAGVNTATGSLIYNSSTGTVQFYDGTGWYDTNRSYAQATGGIIGDYTDPLGVVYRTHTFTSSGTFVVTNAGPGLVDYLVVAGGGGGGCNHGGGGGAGGFRTGSGLAIISNTPYSITVGGGGAGAPTITSPPGASPQGSDGNPSIFSSITSTGGGGGGARNDANNNSPGRPGGSGGGGGGSQPTLPGNWAAGSGNTPSTTPSQGNPGGTGTNTFGGGGGGAGAPGTNGGVPAPGSGFGGAGLPSSISGTSTFYAGGGGGGNTAGSGGTGGGGAGAPNSIPASTAAPAGTYATGGGGGGGTGGFGAGGSGGSGIVIIRYQIGALTAALKATGGLVSYAGGKTIHTFLGSGTFTVTNPSLTSVDYLVVAGGGAGGGYQAGGGGAGGFRTGTGLPVNASPGVYPVTVGAGGGAVLGPNVRGNVGNDSIFSTITSTGGGGGASAPSPVSTGGNGGSGGGGGANSGAAGTGNTPPVSPPQGNNGGIGQPSGPGAGGGGGGAGGNGSNATTPGPQSLGGSGGNGTASSISGTSVTYAGGGGGGVSGPDVSAGSGGSGGGGAGSGTGTGAPGTQNLGGGGGGGGATGPQQGGSGGSGIVIIAYPS